MLAVRGVYDGKTFRVISPEILPSITGEVPVAIVFLTDVGQEEHRQFQIEAAQWMRALRAQMPPLDMSLREMIEEGRER